MDALKDALQDFSGAVEALLAVKYELMALDASDGREQHLRRIEWTLLQVGHVQHLAVSLGSALRNKGRKIPISLPPGAHDTAYYALRGGTTLLTAVAFSARQFISRTTNPNHDEPALCPGILHGLHWAGIGKLVDIISEGIRHGRVH